MSYKSRPLTFAFYRLFFVVALYALGILCLVQPVMEHFYGYSMIPAEPEATHGAILTGAIVSGILSLVYGTIMLRIMTDRRMVKTERRQRQAPIDFPDRRSGIDRRTGEPWAGYN